MKDPRTRNEKDAMQDINACCEYLNTNLAEDTSLDLTKRNAHAVVGFGLGGSLAIQFACYRKRLKTAVAFYGKLPDSSEKAKGLYCPVLYHAAGSNSDVAREAIDRIMDGLGSRDVVCDGEAAVVLWFYELVMGLRPWRKKPVDVWPDSYTRPNEAHRGSDRIIREPAANALDPDWQEAHVQREKTLLWQVGLGATPEGKFKDHRIVIDLEQGPDGSLL